MSENTGSRDGAAGTTFEIYSGPITTEEGPMANELPWQPHQRRRMERILSIGMPDEIVWTRLDRRGRLEPLKNWSKSATLGFRAISRRFSAGLAMIALGRDTLVNGLPALRLSILRPQDSILPSGESRHLYYVTERFSPYVGPPTETILAGDKLCPCCRIPFEPDTTVATCRCGMVYHCETPQSHPGLAESERLDCFGRARTCSNCNCELTTQATLAWDPEEL